MSHTFKVHASTPTPASGGNGEGARPQRSAISTGLVARITARVALAVACGWLIAALLRQWRQAAWPDAARPLAGLRLLLVEHDADSRDALSTLLQLEGAAVTAVGDVESAQARLATEPMPPQGVLLDVDLPECDGESFVRQLRALEAQRRWPRVPALALTGSITRHKRQRLQDAGFSAQLIKPHDVSELLAQLERACAVPDPSQPKRTTRRAHRGAR